MEAKDLMIGDLVRVNRDVCIKNDTIVRVCSIDATNRLVERGLEGSATCVPVGDIDLYYGGIWVKYLSPIPLTPEILEKNFEKKAFYGIYDDYFDIDIREYSDSIYVATFHNCEASFPDQSITLSYVHELQHFLNHCGIDKEITVC